jgi:hypothetical protein
MLHFAHYKLKLTIFILELLILGQDGWLLLKLQVTIVHLG